MWEANLFQKKQLRVEGSKSLFVSEAVKFTLPALKKHPLDDAIDEIELLTFPACNVFELADDDLSLYVAALDIKNYLGKEIDLLGYLITTKAVNTVKNELMYFGTFIDVNGDWLDTVHFPDVQRYYPLGGKGFYKMKGVVTEDFGVYTVEIKYCKKIGYKDRSAKPNNIDVGLQKSIVVN